MRCCQIDQVEAGYLLENIDGRIHDTGVDVSELLEAKAGISGRKELGEIQTGTVSRVIEDV
jgi:hypothetical protein